MRPKLQPPAPSAERAVTDSVRPRCTGAVSPPIITASRDAVTARQVALAGFMTWRIPLFTGRALTMMPALIILGTAVITTLNLYLLWHT